MRNGDRIKPPGTDLLVEEAELKSAKPRKPPAFRLTAIPGSTRSRSLARMRGDFGSLKNG